jgi:hypothetical protein
MCSIAGCEHKTLAHGLCAMHYARVRRFGDPETTVKAGRKTSPVYAYWRSVHPGWSERTLGTFVRAVRLLGDRAPEAIAAATRPNGTVNVSRMLRIANGTGSNCACTRTSVIGSSIPSGCLTSQCPM